ncbi:MAG: ATP-dependent DNA helicase [Candidatus Micrarchaeia archaeon]
MDFYFRFNKPRPSQDKMLEQIYNSLEDKKNILINAPTGIGKTDASISAALTYILRNPEKNLDIFFLTPKISQHAIALESLIGLNKKYNLELKYVDFVGKQNLCTNEDINGVENNAFYHLCNEKTKKHECSYYENTKERIENYTLQDTVKESLLRGHNQLFDLAFKYGLCGYELTSYFAKSARVIIADYSHILNPSINAPFLKKIGKSFSSSIMIWDEAHNVIELASSYSSSTLTLSSIENAKRELKAINSNIDLSYLEFELKKMSSRLGRRSEALVAANDLSSAIFNTSVLNDVEKAALEYITNTKAKRSSLMHLLNFLKLWPSDDDSLIRVISMHNEKPKLDIRCLYPKKAIKIFNNSYANIFMSATMQPLEMYKELFSLNDANMENFDSPFPKANKKVVIDDNFSTKYESRSIEEYKKIAKRISEIKKNIPGNIAVFFPSFEVLEGVFRYIGNEVVFRQKRDMHNPAVELLISEFKKSESSLLFGVMGGSLSEGIDYANNIIKAIIIVGIPFSKPDLQTNAKIEYYNKLFDGKGNEYVYKIPALIRVIQASGRAIRSERDKAIIVLMDKRYKMNSYQSILRKSLPIEESEPIEAIKKFFMQEEKKVIKAD